MCFKFNSLGRDTEYSSSLGMMVAEYKENSKSHVGDAPQDRYAREPVKKGSSGEGRRRGGPGQRRWSRNEDSEGMDKIQEGGWVLPEHRDQLR